MNRSLLLHVVPSLNPATGGPARSVPQLAAALAAAGHPVRVLSLDYAEHGTPEPLPAGTAECITPNALTRALRGWSPRLARRAWALASESRLIHNHGLWMSPNRVAAAAARGNRIPLVISPRGMLGSWALRRNAWAKRAGMLLWQRAALASCAAFHATSEAEAADIRAAGWRQPIAVIPNGVHLPSDPAPARSLIDSACPRSTGHRLLLFLSRLHPKKGVEELLAAWAGQPPALRRGWHLVIAGPDLTGYRPAVETAAARDPEPSSITLAGAVDGALKHALLHHAEALVLPTKEENFGIVIAEALAHGTPALTTHAAPWRTLEEQDCGWWIPGTAEALDHALGRILAAPPDVLAARGARGRDFVARTLGWGAIADKMAAFYDWILHPGPPPPFIQT